MRIVGGKYKGRTLVEFKGNDIRPTSDMARECLFNILQIKIIGASFLDLFSGLKNNVRFFSFFLILRIKYDKI